MQQKEFFESTQNLWTIIPLPEGEIIKELTKCEIQFEA